MSCFVKLMKQKYVALNNKSVTNKMVRNNRIDKF